MQVVIFSTTLMPSDGIWERRTTTLQAAKEELAVLKAQGIEPVCFSQHQTVKLFGVSPATGREQCQDFDLAFVARPLFRTEFGKEYSLEEIEDGGYEVVRVAKIAP